MTVKGDTMTELRNNVLFKGMSSDEVEYIVNRVPHKVKCFNSNEIIVHQGDIVNQIGIVIEGEAVGKKYTPDGEEIIVSKITRNQVFCDILSGTSGCASPVTVETTSKSKILFMDYKSLLFLEYKPVHILLQNMIQNISIKYFAQNKRMDILMMKSVRQKVMAYLTWQQEVKECESFTIDLDRRLMADFLGVERSALSRELSRMKKEGIIDYHKNQFTIFENEE